MVDHNKPNRGLAQCVLRTPGPQRILKSPEVLASHLENYGHGEHFPWQSRRGVACLCPKCLTWGGPWCLNESTNTVTPLAATKVLRL